METLFIMQLCFFVFALCSGKEEVAFTWPFRNLEDKHFPLEIKEKKLQVAHRTGAFGVFSILAMVMIVQGIVQPGGIWQQIFAGAIAGASCGFMYWLVFDIDFANGINKPWHYLGDTADTDEGLVKFLGKNAGKKKALFCVVMIITLNILYVLLLQ